MIEPTNSMCVNQPGHTPFLIRVLPSQTQEASLNKGMQQIVFEVMFLVFVKLILFILMLLIYSPWRLCFFVIAPYINCLSCMKYE